MKIKTSLKIRKVYIICFNTIYNSISDLNGKLPSIVVVNSVSVIFTGILSVVFVSVFPVSAVVVRGLITVAIHFASKINVLTKCIFLIFIGIIFLQYSPV